jgi:hypothetical protein
VSLPWRVCRVTVRVVVVVVVVVAVVLNGAAQLCALQWGGGQKAAAPPLSSKPYVCGLSSPKSQSRVPV